MDIPNKIRKKFKSAPRKAKNKQQYVKEYIDVVLSKNVCKGTAACHYFANNVR